MKHHCLQLAMTDLCGSQVRHRHESQQLSHHTTPHQHCWKHHGSSWRIGITSITSTTFWLKVPTHLYSLSLYIYIYMYTYIYIYSHTDILEPAIPISRLLHCHEAFSSSGSNNGQDRRKRESCNSRICCDMNTGQLDAKIPT